MRKRKLSCAVLAALIMTAGACGGTQTSGTPAQTTAPAAAETTTAAAETTAAQTTTAETTPAQTESAAETTTAAGTEEPAESDGAPDKLYIDDFADERFRAEAEGLKAQTDEFMRTNRFIDYKFIYGPEPSDIPADVQARAVQCSAESEQCRSSAENTDVLSDPELNIAYKSFDGSDISTFISDGAIVPKFVAGWEADFDGDGKTERFLAVQYPFLYPQNPVFFPTQLIFENSSGEMSIVDQVDILNDDIAVMLDYGDFKQFYLNGHGYMGVSEHTTLLGVVDGECKELYSSRIWFSKQGCFLSYSGWQGFSQFMIYDTTANEYRELTGYPADIEKIKRYDPDDVIPLYLPDPESALYLYYVIGGRYLLDTGSMECFKYENGKFTRCEYGAADGITIYPLWKSVGDTDWFDVDIDAALEKSGTSMTKNE